MNEVMSAWRRDNYLTAPGAVEFVAAVPTIVRSAKYTRLLIAIGTNGPVTMSDLYRSVAIETHYALIKGIRTLEQLGVIARQPIHPRNLAVYLNPAHPAHGELKCFLRALALKWPPPPVREAHVSMEPVALPTVVPCSLFGTEVSTRALYLTAVSGTLAARELEHVGLFTSASSANIACRRYEDLGLMRSTTLLTRGTPTAWELDRSFFAHDELQAFASAMAERLHPEEARVLSVLRRR